MKELTEMTLPELAKEIETLQWLQWEYKRKVQHAEAELLQRTAGDFISEMVSRQKTHGSVSKEIDGIKLTYDIKQSVSWDQDKLRSLWEALPPEIGSKLIKTEFSISEAVFKNQIDPNLIDALVDARTTKLSAPTIKLNK